MAIKGRYMAVVLGFVMLLALTGIANATPIDDCVQVPEPSTLLLLGSGLLGLVVAGRKKFRK